jgi:chromosome partitioning protein
VNVWGGAATPLPEDEPLNDPELLEDPEWLDEPEWLSEEEFDDDPETGGMLQFALRDFLDQHGQFDVVLIDCPPNLYQCSWAAMIAADYVLIPVPPEDFGTQGLRAVHQCIDQARQLNPRLRRLGHVITRRDRRLLVHRSYEHRLRELYKQMVLDTIVPEASAFKVSVACRQPVEYYNSNSVAAESMRELAAEIDSKTISKTQRKLVW